MEIELNFGISARGVAEDVGDDLHRRLRRVDVGVADHELLEDVVLDGPGQLRGLHPLLLGRHDVESEHGQHGAVHRHRHRHLVERDAVEELAHVVDRVDGDTRHADVAADAGVVGVVAAVGGQVERDRQALLPGGEVAPVERVGLGGRREPGVLAHRPRLVAYIVGYGPRRYGRDAGVGVQEVDAVEVDGGVERLDTGMPSGASQGVGGAGPGRRGDALARRAARRVKSGSSRTLLVAGVLEHG
jgi:hypothetical protein